jgi:hypothetical protein
MCRVNYPSADKPTDQAVTLPIAAHRFLIFCYIFARQTCGGRNG